MKILISFFVVFVILNCSLIAQNRWVSFTIKNSALPHNRVKTIVIDNNNNVWFGTSQGLASYDGIAWKSYTGNGLFPSYSVNKLSTEKTDIENNLWIATPVGASKINIDNINDVTIYRTDISGINSDVVNYVSVDNDFVKWFGTSLGYSVFKDKKWTVENLVDENNNTLSVNCIGNSKDGWNYLGTNGGGVVRRKKEVDGYTGASSYDHWSGLLSYNINCIYVEDNGYQWYGTSWGAAYHRQTETQVEWYLFTTDEGVSDNQVFSIFAENKNKIWLGTANGITVLDISGLEDKVWIEQENIYSQVKISKFSKKDGLVGDSIFDIQRDKNGVIWCATNAGVSKYGEVTSIDYNSNTYNENYFNISISPNPFSKFVDISYQTTENERVNIEIADVNGKVIISESNNYKLGTKCTYTWNCKDANGNIVKPGIYLFKLSSDKFIQVAKMLYIK